MKENIETKPDFLEQVYRNDHLEKLNKVKAYVMEISKKRKAVEIKIPAGVIMTTRPQHWDEHNKVILRGNALNR